ncbi:MAG TPA: GNAT family N-acetyltransferase [Gemmatimonadaceae bacterium]|jgi:phosphinothricin acetyltransferase
MSVVRRDEHFEIGIREATDADLISIVDILNREIRESPFIWRDEPVTVEARREWLAQHRAAGQPVLVACDDSGIVVGWASLSTFRASSGYRFSCEVSVYVARDQHRRGIARRLLESLHDAGRRMDLHALIAAIDAEHTASIRLFEGFGYVAMTPAAELGFKFGQWRREVFMVRQLGDAPP